MSDVLELTAAQAIERISAGELGSDEYFDAYAEAAAGDEIGAYLWRAEPGSSDGSTGELNGAPIAVKDIFCTKGTQTTAGSRILEGYRPPYSATAVRRLAEAGAQLLGKTNMDEFAMGSSNENSGYGPVRNPWDRERVPGGSSGGSAAVVAARLAPWAIGTDTGGSIRQPASLCGVVGLKPTYGAISRYGMVAFASSLDQCGPLTRDVTDAAILLRAMEGRDPCDSTSVGIEGGVELPSRVDLKGLRFGVPRPRESRAACATCSSARSPSSGTSARRSTTASCPTRRTASRPITSSLPRRHRRTSPATTGSATACARAPPPMSRVASGTGSPRPRASWSPCTSEPGPRASDRRSSGA
jgi:Asp-tRNA(Asn)/Glu-tRNA(Gln) amidotransferase A subunit family amidase